MTNAPADLLAFRRTVMAATGFTNPVEVGIAPDRRHVKGYHVGVASIRAAGNFNDDYSTRQARDRAVGGDDACAMDIGDNWPRGGRAAWIRFNNAFAAALRAGDPALVAVRAVNFSPDGVARKRFDTNNRTQGVINSTDTVDTHTHIEWWRDTLGRRQASFDQIAQLIAAAIAGGPTPNQGANMADVNLSWGETLSAYLSRIEKIWVPATQAAAQQTALLTAIAKAQGVAQADLDAIEARVGTVELTDEQVTAIADRLIASGANGLTEADHAGVVADVKQALREGSNTP